MNTLKLRLKLAQAKDSSNAHRYQIIEHYIRLTQTDEPLPALPKKWLALIPEAYRHQLTCRTTRELQTNSPMISKGSILSWGEQAVPVTVLQEIVPFSWKLASLRLKDGTIINYTNISDRFVPLNSLISANPGESYLVIVIGSGKDEKCLLVPAAACKLLNGDGQ